MTSKRKRAKRAKPPVRSESEEFLWHLLPPFVEEYSHQHWWGAAAQGVELEAAIWEILRRHPYTEWFLTQNLVDWEANPADEEWSPKEQFLQENLHPYWRHRRRKYVEFIRAWSYWNRPAGKDFDLMLEAYAFYSWLELPKKEQKHWKQELFKQLDLQHGYCPDLSYLVNVLPDIYSMSKEVLTKLRVAAKRHYSTASRDESLRKTWNKELKENALIGGFAWGQIFVGFDPCVPNIEKLVMERVRAIVQKWRRLFPKSHVKSHDRRPPGRARVADWLGIIKRFEQAELSRDDGTKRDDQLFARYRRTIGGWIL
jgi:hypothetical protein